MKHRSPLQRIRKQLHELRHRIANYRYWRSKGFSPALAWKKADLTF